MNLPAVANQYEQYRSSEESVMPSSSGKIVFDESSLGEGGTPRDVRMFPLSESPRRSSSSSSIPIAPSSKVTADDAQFAHDTAAAQYRDYIMYQRIVTAKLRQLQAKPDNVKRVPALHPQVTDYLQSLLYQSDTSFPPQTQDLPLGPCSRVAFAHDDNDYAEEGVFELEL